MALLIDVKNGDTLIKSITDANKILLLDTKNTFLTDNITIDVVSGGGGGIDPSDATATAADLLYGKTAYIADGSKATGIIREYDGSLKPGPTPVGFQGLTFTANTAGSTVGMSLAGTPTLGLNFSYSTDGTTWNTFTPGTTTITLATAGDKVYFKGNNPDGVNEISTSNPEDLSVQHSFTCTGSVAVSGNLMSLIDNGACTATTIPNSSCFGRLFISNTAITSAPDLLATTLTSYCYYGMFYGCTALVTGPKIAATGVLPLSSILYLCRGCTSLQRIPCFYATEYYGNCLYNAFRGCSSLNIYTSSGEGHTYEWRLPMTGTGTTSGTDQFKDIFRDIGTGAGTTVTVNTTYYLELAPVSIS